MDALAHGRPLGLEPIGRPPHLVVRAIGFWRPTSPDWNPSPLSPPVWVTIDKMLSPALTFCFSSVKCG